MDANGEVGSPELRARAIAAQCPGVAELIDFLEAQRKLGIRITKIGSGTVDFHGRAKALRARPHTEEEAFMLIMSLPAVHFGRADGKRTPIEDIASILEKIEGYETEQRIKVDRFCLELARNDIEFEIILGKLILTEPVQ